MASIFLSHSSQDNEVASDLACRLREHGYDSLFLDFDLDSGIKAGRDWERELYRNLKLGGAVIVLCSPSSMASRWCFRRDRSGQLWARRFSDPESIRCRMRRWFCGAVGREHKPTPDR